MFAPALAILRRHRLLTVVLCGGVGLRAVIWWAYRPDTSWDLAALQALAAVSVATLGYVLLLRGGAWRWLATLAVLPILWDARQLQIEQSGPVLVALTAGGPAPSGSRLAGFVTAYQRHGYLPTAVLLGSLLVGLAAAAGLGRARHTKLRLWSLVASLAAMVPVGLALLSGFPWYQELPGIVLLPVAGALGVTALLRGSRGRSANLPQVDDTDSRALSAFAGRYPGLRLAPVTVVIAAYDEANGIGAVCRRVPRTTCGLDVDVLVVDDGSSDDTADRAAAAGAMVCRSEPNRGQGAALRLGYRIAREYGARFIVTTDADGQYDPAELPALLAPLLAGSADFVTGSRRLGSSDTADRVRHAGVFVFAVVVSLLFGRRITDTSFGQRALRAEITEDLVLNQPQYQSAELLIGALSRGYRVVEVPGAMRRRTAGHTKKGGNLGYAFRYARTVVGTWWREGCPRPVGVDLSGR